MARTLDVYLHNDLVGHLIQDDGGQMVFNYAEPWLNNPGATPLSQSLPLRKERFNRNECRGYFGGILPEESKREIIAGNLGISARNDYAMLEQIGGECAGAVTFIPAGQGDPLSPDLVVLLEADERGGRKRGVNGKRVATRPFVFSPPCSQRRFRQNMFPTDLRSGKPVNIGAAKTGR